MREKNNITKRTVMKIVQALGVNKELVEVKKNTFRFEIVHPQKRYKLIVEILQNMNDGKRKGTLACVISPVGISQLHFLTDVVMSDELGEVILFAEENQSVSAFIISKDASFNTFMNVSKDLLKSDILKIHPFFVSCAVQLGLAEHKFLKLKRKHLDRNT